MQVQEHADRLAAIRAAFPKEGLFAEKEWLLSPDAFPIDRKSLADLEQLGHRLFVFQRACNQLYQLSIKGKQPEWLARYLDAGKPKELIEFSRRKEIRDDLPRVIRPDLILTDEGYIIAEIDSVPGGIGLTGWLNQTYSAFDNDVVGGANGMLDGFESVLPNGGDIDIVISIGALCLPKIMSRRTAAPFIASSSYLICRTFQRSTARSARMPRTESRLRRQSSRISKKKCGSH